jgi:hypothetical protein
MPVASLDIEDSAHGASDGTQALKAAALAATLKGINGKPGRPEEADLVPGTKEYKSHLPATEICKADINTKDEWVPR